MGKMDGRGCGMRVLTVCGMVAGLLLALGTPPISAASPPTIQALPGADAAFVTGWIARYDRGWLDGSCAGFVARDSGDDRFLDV